MEVHVKRVAGNQAGEEHKQKNFVIDFDIHKDAFFEQIGIIDA